MTNLLTYFACCSYAKKGIIPYGRNAAYLFPDDMKFGIDDASLFNVMVSYRYGQSFSINTEYNIKKKI